MSTERADVAARLAAVRHYECGDSWYSCPESSEGCSNDAEGDECNCHAPLMHTAARLLRNPAEPDPAAILGRILTTGDAAVYTAADGSRFLGLDYPTVDLTDAEAAYLEALDR